MMTSLKTPWGILVFLVFLTGPVGLLIDTNLARQELKALHVLVTRTESGIDPTSDAGDQLSPSLQLLLHGDPSANDRLARWRSLHETYPESPHHYARYLQETDSLPSGFRETVNRIAPQNGWFDLWEIAKISPIAFREIESEEEDEWTDAIPQYEILSDQRLARAIALIHTAADKPDYTDYYLETQSLLVAELDDPETWIDEINYIAQLVSVMAPTAEILGIKQFIGAACQSAISNNDKAAFLRLEESFRKLSHKLFRNSHDLIGGVVFEALVTRISQQLVLGARHFGLQALEKKYRDLRNDLDEHHLEMVAQRNGETTDQNQLLLEEHGSILARLTTPINPTTRADKITRSDLRPSRRAENAVFSRLFTSALFVIFTALGIDAWIRKLRMPWEIADHLSGQSFPPSARWRVLAVGVLSPFLCFLGYYYLTPAGAIEQAFSETQFAHQTLSFLAIMLIIISTIDLTTRSPAQASRPRDRVRLALQTLPLIVLFLCAISQPLDQQALLLSLATLIAVGSIFWLTFRAFRRNQSKTAALYLKNELALPCFFLAAGLFGIWTWALVAEEKFWIARDHFASPSGYFPSQYEAKTVKQYLRELEEFLP